jgi:CRISPR-associated endonuclease/helicase Cas3
MSRALAHSANAAGQTHDLERHLLDVAGSSAAFAAKFGAAVFGHWTGLWHDLGKFHPDFQTYLANPSGAHGPDHSSAGMVQALRYWDGLAFLVAGHHAGLPSFVDLKKRVAEKQAAESVRKALEIAHKAMAGLAPSEPLAGGLPDFVRPRHARDAQSKRNCELLLRMLFSALADADFLDTEAHFQPERASGRSGAPALKELWQRFEADQGRLTGQADSPLQQARHAIYRACLDAADLPPGLFRLTVPTGGGKTRSGMAFALRHALRHGLDRVIVAIPYTSIIEQTADVYRGIFGDAAVLEHHSAVADPGGPDSPVTARPGRTHQLPQLLIPQGLAS